MSIYDERYMWEVPPQDAATSGILLSDRISFYVDAIKLIEPFRPESLRPACYDLHVGDSYYLNDRLCALKPGESIEIPPSGLVYIKIEERLNLPYYMVARYSLRVTQVYRGLLIDNGLQIDPGYHGQFHAVVHNLSNEARLVKRGEEFLSIEFTRTTPFAPAGPTPMKSEKELIRSGGLSGFALRPLAVFTKRPEDFGVSREPTFFLLKYGDRDHKSSTHETREKVTAVEDRVSRFENSINQQIAEHQRITTKELKRWRNLSLFSVATIAVAVGLGVLQFYTGFYTWYSDRYSELVVRYSEGHSQFSSALAEKEEEIAKLKESVAQLQTRLNDLENRKK